MELPVGVAVRITQRFDVMQVVTIVAGSGIHIAGGDTLAMYGFLIHCQLVMTLDTFCNYLALVFFPVIVGMDVCMAICAHYAFADVNAGVMLCIFLLVAPFALNFLNFDLFPHVLGQIGDINVTAGTGVFSMHRSGEGMD